MRCVEVTHRFVDTDPDEPVEGVIYVSMERATALHRCLCGCGSKVTTPLDPAHWTLEFDGRTISLRPAIDNWLLDCRSHYKIKRNRVRWLMSWTLADADT